MRSVRWHVAARLELLEAVHRYRFRQPSGSHESLVEFDRLRTVKDTLIQKIVATCVDTATAARLRPSDSQRVARAWEVWRGTGTGLAVWQSRRGEAAPVLARVVLDEFSKTVRVYPNKFRPARLRAMGAFVAQSIWREHDPPMQVPPGSLAEAMRSAPVAARATANPPTIAVPSEAGGAAAAAAAAAASADTGDADDEEDEKEEDKEDEVVPEPRAGGAAEAVAAAAFLAEAARDPDSDAARRMRR